jgi:hypothetical protein
MPVTDLLPEVTVAVIATGSIGEALVPTMTGCVVGTTMAMFPVAPLELRPNTTFEMILLLALMVPVTVTKLDCRQGADIRSVMVPTPFDDVEFTAVVEMVVLEEGLT